MKRSAFNRRASPSAGGVLSSSVIKTAAVATFLANSKKIIGKTKHQQKEFLRSRNRQRSS